MKDFLIIILVSSLICSLLGCSSQRGGALVIEELYTSNKFTALLNQELEVNTGDAIFIDGCYIPGEYIVVQKSLDMMIPGSMMIPFPVHIDSGRLELTRIEAYWKYYCAEEGRAAASFPGLGSVIRQGDCVGIRISLDNAKKQWVVDNSNYNNMPTIWTKSLKESEPESYAPEISDNPFKVKSLRRIFFDGYYANQLHFTWEDIRDTFRETKEFTFDFAGTPTIVGIRGKQFKVLSVDNIRLRYQWIKLR